MEDEEDEVGIIKVQRGYVTQRQDRDQEAETIYDQVLQNKPSDIGLTAVTSYNLISVNQHQIFDSKKAATVDSLETKLNNSQRSAIFLALPKLLQMFQFFGILILGFQ